MKTITTDYVRNHLEILIDEITEPVRIEGRKKKAVVMIDAEDFERLLRSNERKRLSSGEKKSVTSIFGLFRHRAQPLPVSVEEMESIIKKRRYERMAG